MADRLELTLIRVRDGHRFEPPVVVDVDREDHDRLREHLVQLARLRDGRSQDGWEPEYALKVKGVDRAWIEFEILGAA